MGVAGSKLFDTLIVFLEPEAMLEISSAHKTKIPTNKEAHLAFFKSLRCCIYHANNVKMPTIVGILTFMSRINFYAQLS